VDVNEGPKKGNVDIWMGELEQVMFKTMKGITKASIQEYAKKPRTEWVRNWPG
jgi:dynein heavy chain